MFTSTHRGVGAAEPATYWVPAASGPIIAGIITVTVDNCCLWVREVRAFEAPEGGDGQIGGARGLRSLFLHHGHVHPRLVVFHTQLQGQVTGESWGAAVGEVGAAHSLQTHKRHF